MKMYRKFAAVKRKNNNKVMQQHTERRKMTEMKNLNAICLVLIIFAFAYNHFSLSECSVSLWIFSSRQQNSFVLIVALWVCVCVSIQSWITFVYIAELLGTIHSKQMPVRVTMKFLVARIKTNEQYTPHTSSTNSIDQKRVKGLIVKNSELFC